MTGTLLILHDSAEFGGHERMLLSLLPGLLDARRFERIVFTVPTTNERLLAALAGFAPAITVRPWSALKQRGEPYLRFLRLGYRRRVARLVADEAPSTILLVQGRIENLASALPALPRHVRVVSYVPMAHPMAAMGRSGLIGDRVRRPLYRRPDGYVVPSDAVAAQLRAHGVTVPIEVAHNIVSPPPRTERSVARDTLGLPLDRRVALVLGRLDPAQKGIDRLLAAIARTPPARLAEWCIVFVGDGPGRAAVEAATATLPAGLVRLVRWTERPDLYLSAADVLLMPSRWEGLPLAMLEAMTYCVPVLASPLDVFRAFLPPDNLWDVDGGDLASALDRAIAPARAAAFAEHARRILAPLTIDHARAAFVRALDPGHAG